MVTVPYHLRIEKKRGAKEPCGRALPGPVSTGVRPDIHPIPCRAMKVIIMGNGRVGSELSIELLEGGHGVTVIDKNPEAFYKYPPGEGARTMVGLGFDRDVLEQAGIAEADAFVAVSSGDNSNIVSARVALERYQVPKVVARIYDPRRAEIYERLNIPTVATTKWGVKQIQLMLLHDRSELREAIGGGDLLRMRVPVPAHLVGRSPLSLNVDGKLMVVGRVARRRRVHPHGRQHAAGGRLHGRDHGEGRHGSAR